MTDLRPEELVNEGTVEAVAPVVEQVAESVAKGSIDWKKFGKAGLAVAVVAGVGFAGYKFLKNKKAKANVDETCEDDIVDAEAKETSEEAEKDSEQ